MTEPPTQAATEDTGVARVAPAVEDGSVLRRTRVCRMMPSAALALGLAVIFVLPLSMGIRAASTDSVLIMPDLFETLIASLGASHGQQFVGAWSRIGLYHPGPLWFYWAAPFVALSDGQPASLFLAALALVGVCGAATASVVWRSLGPWCGLTAVVVIACAFHQLSLAGLSYPWNPTVVVMPVTLGLVSAAASISRGTPSSAVVGSATGAFVAQAHLGSVLLGLFIIGASIAGPIVATRRDRLAPSFRAWVLILGAVVAPWLPVAFDQASGAGNASAVVRYAVTGRVDERFPAEAPSRSLSLSLTDVPSHVAGMTSLVEPETARWGGADFLRGLEHDPAPRSLVVLVALLAVTGFGALWLSRWPLTAASVFVTWLCRVNLVAVAATFVAAARARSEFRFYLIASASGVGITLWLGTLLVLILVCRQTVAARRFATLRWSRPAVAISLILATFILAAQSPMRDFAGLKLHVDHDHPTLARLVHVYPEGNFTVVADDVADLGVQSRLVVSLDRAGRRVHVSGRYASRFSDYNRRATPGHSLNFTTSSAGCRPMGHYEGRVLCVS